MFHEKGEDVPKLGNTGERKEVLLTPGGHRGAFCHPSYRLWGGVWSPCPSNSCSHPSVLLSAPQGSSHPSLLSSFHLGQTPPTPGHGPCCSHCLEHCSLSFYPCHTWTPCNPPGRLLPDGRILIRSHILSFPALRLELKCAHLGLRFSSHPNTL